MNEYRVLVISSPKSRARGKILQYVVNNSPDGWDHSKRSWPSVAKFPIDVGYGDTAQKQRAQEYAAYMNKTHPVAPSIGETACK